MQDVFFSDEPPMTMDDYEGVAAETAIYPGNVLYVALGLASECGEVLDKIKKYIRDDFVDLTQEDIAAQLDAEQSFAIVQEVGDVIWYCTNLANDLGYSLEEVCEINMNKLLDRKHRNTLHGSGDNR